MARKRERGNIQGRSGSERGKESERSLHKLGITVSWSNERSMGEVSRAGGILDHASDAFFVASGLAAYAALGVVPWLLAPLLALAFVQYALDSRVLSGRRLRSSRVGRLNGVAYFVLLGTPLVRDALGWPWPANGWIFVAGWGLVVSTAFSMIDRARAWLLSRRVPDSPGAER